MTPQPKIRNVIPGWRIQDDRLCHCIQDGRLRKQGFTPAVSGTNIDLRNGKPAPAHDRKENRRSFGGTATTLPTCCCGCEICCAAARSRVASTAKRAGVLVEEGVREQRPPTPLSEAAL